MASATHRRHGLHPTLTARPSRTELAGRPSSALGQLPQLPQLCTWEAAPVALVLASVREGSRAHIRPSATTTPSTMPGCAGHDNQGGGDTVGRQVGTRLVGRACSARRSAPNSAAWAGMESRARTAKPSCCSRQAPPQCRLWRNPTHRHVRRAEAQIHSLICLQLSLLPQPPACSCNVAAVAAVPTGICRQGLGCCRGGGGGRRCCAGVKGSRNHAPQRAVEVET